MIRSINSSLDFLICGHAECIEIVLFIYNFSDRKGGLGGRSALRQPQAGSTVLLQIQRASYGEPPTPSASDLTLELDQY